MPQIWDLPLLTELNENDYMLVGHSADKTLCRSPSTLFSGRTKTVPFTFNSNLSVTCLPSNGDPSYSMENIPFTIISLAPGISLATVLIDGSLTFTSLRANRSPQIAFSPSSPDLFTGAPLFFSWDMYTGFYEQKSPVLSVENNAICICERTYYTEGTTGATGVTTARYGNNFTVLKPKMSAIIFAGIDEIS